MLDDFSHELESTQSRLDTVMKKLAKVSHMTSGMLVLLSPAGLVGCFIWGYSWLCFRNDSWWA